MYWKGNVGLAILSSVMLVSMMQTALALNKKQQSYQAQHYRTCMTTDAKFNIEWLGLYNLKSNKLKAYCRCKSAYVARQFDTPRFFEALTVSQIKCARDLGGRFP